MKTYKLAAFDMDGTLLNSNKEIRASAAAAKEDLMMQVMVDGISYVEAADAANLPASR